MGASYWGLLAKVGPYKLTRSDEKHLHERGSGLHYNSAFKRMMPSSNGAETLPPGIQSQEAWLPKIDWGMYENPKFQQGITGRGYTFRPGQTTDRDRAIFNTMENRNYADQNISNLNTERRPSVFMDGTYTPAGSPKVINPPNRPSVTPLKVEIPKHEDYTEHDRLADMLRNYLANAPTPSSSGSGMSAIYGDYAPLYASPANTSMAGSYYKPGSRGYRQAYYNHQVNLYKQIYATPGTKQPSINDVEMTPRVNTVAIPKITAKKRYYDNQGRVITRAKWLKLKKIKPKAKKVTSTTKVSSAQARDFENANKKRGNFGSNNEFQNSKKKKQ